MKIKLDLGNHPFHPIQPILIDWRMRHPDESSLTDEQVCERLASEFSGPFTLGEASERFQKIKAPGTPRSSPVKP